MRVWVVGGGSLGVAIFAFFAGGPEGGRGVGSFPCAEAGRFQRTLLGMIGLLQTVLGLACEISSLAFCFSFWFWQRLVILAIASRRRLSSPMRLGGLPTGNSAPGERLGAMATGWHATGWAAQCRTMGSLSSCLTSSNLLSLKKKL